MRTISLTFNACPELVEGFNLQRGKTSSKVQRPTEKQVQRSTFNVQREKGAWERKRFSKPFDAETRRRGDAVKIRSSLKEIAWSTTRLSGIHFKICFTLALTLIA